MSHKHSVRKLLHLSATLLISVFLLAACGQPGGSGTASQPEEASAAAPSVLSNRVPGATGNGKDGGTPSGTGQASGSATPDVASAASGEEIQVFSGVIADTGMGKLLVEAPDGLTVAFDITSADTTALEDSRPGNRVNVYYTGTLNGSDTSGITVLRVETAR